MVEGTYIFDCEVFAHDWLFVFKEVATGEYTVIWNDNDEVLAFMERNPYLGGFNNKHYDNHILKAVMCGFTPEQVKEINDLIIVHELNGWDIPALREYRVYFDSFTMWLSCNDLPSVKDKSLFASDRVRVIEFNRHFTDEEQDKGLKDYFETPEAMRGIFTWLVAGYFKYIRFGLKMSRGMQKVIKQYEKDNDLVLQFLEEKCERKDEGYTKAKSLYDNYKLWCKGCGYYVCSMKKFNAELTAHPEWYADKGVINGVAVYYGMGMKSN